VHDTRTVQVTINLHANAGGIWHWYVTTSEELQTVQWADDGSVDSYSTAITRALEIARAELLHFARGGSVTI